MVIVNDFEFQIVSAEDKIPFKEHKKGLNTYVEVEPDAEYFVSVRRVRDSTEQVMCKIMVDDQSLGRKFYSKKATASAKFCGISSRSKGVKTNKALKFVKASFTSGDNTDTGSTMAGMGKIEMNVNKAILTGQQSSRSRDTIKQKSFVTSTIEMVDKASVTMKKNLRSGEGLIVETSTYDSNKVTKKYIHSKGDSLCKITLHYCATPGLVAVGVLPKPPLWDHARMLKPAMSTAKEKKKLDKAVVSVNRNHNGIEILELDDNSNSDSDIDEVKDTEIDKKPVYTKRASSKHKKAKIESSKATISWDRLRKLKPAMSTAKEQEKLNKAVVSVKRNRNGNEILTLDDNSDSDSDINEVKDTEIDQKPVHTKRASSKHKKAKIESSRITV